MRESLTAARRSGTVTCLHQKNGNVSVATSQTLSAQRDRLTEMLAKDDLPGAVRKELATLRLATELRLALRKKHPGLDEPQPWRPTKLASGP